MNEIKIFSKPEFGRVGVLTAQDGTPWFNAVDVCNVLGYSNSRDALRKHVDADDVTKRDTLTAGGRQKVNFINESGVYSLILRSKLPRAEAFQYWVTSEVLPSIRKHGAYFTPEAMKKSLTDPAFVKELVNVLAEEQGQKACSRYAAGIAVDKRASASERNV